jgi:enoyl-CoA hydratase/carnithine racemase
MSIKTALINHVATIEIARPEKKNALTLAMYQAMADALKAANDNPEVRSVLITGQPGIFTSGNDLDDFVQRPPSIGPDGGDSPIWAFMQALIHCEKPVIAAVTGGAIGIGTTMLLHCDLVYVSDEARLAMPFVNLGLVPEFAASLLVPLRMGYPKAAERLLLGDPFTGAEAVESGIANAVLPAGEVLAHARRIAERFNTMAPQALRTTKQLLRAPHREAIHAVMLEEARLFAQKLRDPEAREAMQAFFERRKPAFCPAG